ncbi:hypothetical protein [Sphingomonas alpina]|uniref:Uncharacterized protein n=1 Tax=Sphingomonas alpina TaxID=653931 RepID=A0A7H0LHU5_9SPHN|nr:hypothetical protein [Sphingomonas alpina]QNQ09248.1 hypothetical protein H3Z74_21680 [Sphingomonas alpina]
MARVTPVQTNFNGGEISRRLHSRFDLNLYDIGLAELAGWVPLPEGGIDATPGFIYVEMAAGPCRLMPFDYNATQGYVLEMSDGIARLFTNDARIEDAGDPVEVEIPYSFAQIGGLNYEQSYDVLYLFHPEVQTQLFTRTGADTFVVDPLELENGPFEPRNKIETRVVSASAVSGTVTLTATGPIFEAGDVGGLFQLEADDFGDISSWEPGITVTVGQLLVWNERVYRVAGGSGRTGTVAPIHNKGVEWDGIGQGKDLNDKNAGGVQLEYMHDRFGVLRITAYTDSTHVTALVLRQLPFTAATSYDYEGGYWDEWGNYVPPENSVTYGFGSWRWRFGAFSTRRGWPTCGVVWNERLVLAKGSTIYGSVTGDLTDHSTYNELGEISSDMAFIATVKDPNGIVGLIADDKLLMMTASGMFALGPSNAASGVGPNNLRVDRENNEGAAATMPVELDGRSVYIGKSRRRVIEAAYQAQRDRQDSIDLSRYARHIGAPRFLSLASQKDPNRLIWALRADGTLAVAAYVPEEQVLGWATRPLAPGLLAKSICTITDPAGELSQLWVSIERDGAWHVARLSQFRQEDDEQDPVMTDLAWEYDGAPATEFGPVPWLAGAAVQVQASVADGVGVTYRSVTVDGDGMFEIGNPASRVAVGLPFLARFTTLPGNGGSENGPAMGKMRRISRMAISVLKTRGLQISVQGTTPRDIEQLFADSTTNEGFQPDTGIVTLEDCGEHDRFGQITVTRVAPCGATIRAIQPTTDVAAR